MKYGPNIRGALVHVTGNPVNTLHMLIKAASRLKFFIFYFGSSLYDFVHISFMLAYGRIVLSHILLFLYSRYLCITTNKQSFAPCEVSRVHLPQSTELMRHQDGIATASSSAVLCSVMVMFAFICLLLLRFLHLGILRMWSQSAVCH